MTATEAVHLTDRVLADPRRWNSEQIATELNVTICERDAYRLTTFGSMDMSRKERHKRDVRLRLARHRRKAKKKSRAEYLAKNNISVANRGLRMG
jgi:IS30 family transposase